MEIGEFAWANVYLDEAVEATRSTIILGLHTDAVLTRLLVLAPRHRRSRRLAERGRARGRTCPARGRARARPRPARQGLAPARLRPRLGLPVGESGGRRRTGARARSPRRGRPPGGAPRRRVHGGPLRRPDPGRRGDRALRGDRRSRPRRPPGGGPRPLLAGLSPRDAGRLRRRRGSCTGAQATCCGISEEPCSRPRPRSRPRASSFSRATRCAEEELARDYAALAAMGERYFLPLVAAHLAEAVQAQGRDVGGGAARGAGAGARGRTTTSRPRRSGGASARRRVRRRDGWTRPSGSSARASTILAPTDAPVMRADALVDLAEVLLADGDPEGQTALEEALALYARKGNTVAAARVRDLLDDLVPRAEGRSLARVLGVLPVPNTWSTTWIPFLRYFVTSTMQLSSPGGSGQACTLPDRLGGILVGRLPEDEVLRLRSGRQDLALEGERHDGGLRQRRNGHEGNLSRARHGGRTAWVRRRPLRLADGDRRARQDGRLGEGRRSWTADWRRLQVVRGDRAGRGRAGADRVGVPCRRDARRVGVGLREGSAVAPLYVTSETTETSSALVRRGEGDELLDGLPDGARCRSRTRRASSRRLPAPGSTTCSEARARRTRTSLPGCGRRSRPG